jgi:hypothetical protein
VPEAGVPSFIFPVVVVSSAPHPVEQRTSQVAFGPGPIAVFGDQTGVNGQNKITRLAWDDLDSARFRGRMPLNNREAKRLRQNR